MIQAFTQNYWHLPGKMSIPWFMHTKNLFVNADQVFGSTTQTEKLCQAAWWEMVQTTGISRVDNETACEQVTDDKTRTLENQLQWLMELGFREVEYWYKFFNFAVFSGTM